MENSLQPRILHVFDNACNLINEHNEVLSVVTRQIGNGPFNLVIESEISFSEHLDADSAISILGDQLLLEELMIEARNAEVWNPRPDWEMLHARRNKIRDSLLALKIAPAATRLHIPGYQSLVSALCTAIVDVDISSAVGAAEELAGLGAGLTPSGDDVMLGAIYAAWIIHPLHLAKSLAEEIANAAGPRTTSLSAAWLRSAGGGETGILWHQVFDVLSADLASDPASMSEVQKAANRILNVGETSGADALSGFVRTFVSYSEKASV